MMAHCTPSVSTNLVTVAAVAAAAALLLLAALQCNHAMTTAVGTPMGCNGGRQTVQAALWRYMYSVRIVGRPLHARLEFGFAWLATCGLWLKLDFAKSPM
jgi:hypothetical protein